MKRSALFTVLLLIIVASNAFAGVSREVQARRDLSAKTPLVFTVDSSLQSAVMGQAQVLITQWNDYGGAPAMKFQTVTDNLIQTYNAEQGTVGFTVTCAKLPSGSQFTISAQYMFGHNEPIEARLLSYLLQQYAQSLAVSVPTQTPEVTPSIPEEMDLYIKLIRTQISEGKYDASLVTLTLLRTAIETKSKESHAVTATETPKKQ